MHDVDEDPEEILLEIIDYLDLLVDSFIIGSIVVEHENSCYAVHPLSVAEFLVIFTVGEEDGFEGGLGFFGLEVFFCGEGSGDIFCDLDFLLFDEIWGVVVSVGESMEEVFILRFSCFDFGEYFPDLSSTVEGDSSQDWIVEDFFGNIIKMAFANNLLPLLITEDSFGCWIDLIEGRVKLWF